VVPVPAGPAREVAFRYKVNKAQKRPATKKPTSSEAAEKLPFMSNVVRPGAVITTVLIIVGLSGIGWFGSQILQGNKLASLETFSSPAPVKAATGIKPLPRSEPTHITVPSVGIDAPVGPVGQDAEGSIAVPPVEEWVTGWYKYSPTPGEDGPSVIVGHVDTYKGVSVFWRLREVQRGDIINITRADGKTVKFKVTSLKQFDQDKFPTKEVYGNLKYPGLRLITCAGTFNKDTGSYTQNTVVYAFMVK